MWFTRHQFALCHELRALGLAPRFEPGDVVARGFADLGFEEFQVLPGPSLLSLTAGSVSSLPEGHGSHFFWIPSIDEAIELLEAKGAVLGSMMREEGRSWTIFFRDCGGNERTVRAETVHDVVLQALHTVLSDSGGGLS